MKVKLVLCKLISQSTIKSMEISELNQNLIESKTMPNTTTKREDQLEYFVNEPNEQVITIKEAIASKIKVPIDSLQLFKPNQLNRELYDGDPISHYISSNEKEEEEADIPIKYSINKTTVKVTVDFYQNNIEKLSLKLSSTCSILMVKHMISTKLLNNAIPISEQKLYCTGLFNKANQISINTNLNKQFEDSTNLLNIISTYMNSMATLSQRYTPIQNENIAIHFLLVRQINSKQLHMGLNFKFNYFKSLSKISFNSTAPNYRECSDGINLLSYCRNINCSISNELFVVVLGYGCFDIIREAFRTVCPKCLSQNKQIEVKNLGLVNAKWNYKGILYSKKDNVFEGDGVTIDDKLYILPETNIINLMTKLIIEAKPYKFIGNENNSSNSNGKGVDSDSNSLNSISLFLPGEDNHNNKDDKMKRKYNRIVFNKNEGIQVYENESDFNVSDIQIDKEERNVCEGCSKELFLNKGCSIF